MRKAKVIQQRVGRAASLGFAQRLYEKTAIFGLLLGLVSAAIGSPLGAQNAHPVLREFQPDGGYVLARDGEQVEARIFLSRKASALLVVSPALDQPLLVWAGSQAVDQVGADHLLERVEGFDLSDAVERSFLGKLTPQEDNSILLPEVDGAEFRLRPRPAVIGFVELADLLAEAPEYIEPMNDYTPSAAQLTELESSLAALPEPIEVRSYFAIWCGVCKRVLPYQLKLQQALAGSSAASKVEFELYGLDYPPKGWEQPEAKEAGVKGLPMVVVSRGGVEIGRFGGAEQMQNPVAALLEVLGQ